VGSARSGIWGCGRDSSDGLLRLLKVGARVSKTPSRVRIAFANTPSLPLPGGLNHAGRALSRGASGLPTPLARSTRSAYAS